MDFEKRFHFINRYLFEPFANFPGPSESRLEENRFSTLDPLNTLEAHSTDSVSHVALNAPYIASNDKLLEALKQLNLPVDSNFVKKHKKEEQKVYYRLFESIVEEIVKPWRVELQAMELCL